MCTCVTHNAQRRCASELFLGYNTEEKNNRIVMKVSPALLRSIYHPFYRWATLGRARGSSPLKLNGERSSAKPGAHDCCTHGFTTAPE